MKLVTVAPLASFLALIVLFSGDSHSAPSQSMWPSLSLGDTGKNVRYMQTLLSIASNGGDEKFMSSQLREEFQQSRFGSATLVALKSFLCKQGVLSCRDSVSVVSDSTWVFLLEKALAENPSSISKFAQSQSNLDLTKPANLKLLRSTTFDIGGRVGSQLLSFVSSKAKRSEVSLGSTEFNITRDEQSFSPDQYPHMRQNLVKFMMEKISLLHKGKIVHFGRISNCEAKV